jgi:GDPmannose 4,6-dehydratase
VRGTLSGLPAEVDVRDPTHVDALMQQLCPDEVYYLAAFHHSSEDVPLGDAALYRRSHEIHVDGLLNFLESARRHAPRTRLFYAASSLIFGDPAQVPQDETTSIHPQCLYGITKATGCHLMRHYRNRHGLFACNGILYNHESPLRAERFVTQKIITAAIDIQRGRSTRLVLGDLSSATDWGYAPDYVAAMHAILLADNADDYVIATGISHTVQEFVETAFGLLGLDWKQYVSEDRSILVRKRGRLVGNPAKLARATGWKPSVDLKEMIRRLLAAKGAFHA